MKSIKINHKNIKAFHGSALHAKGWIQEAALRMLLNNLDHEVAENPDELVVYGGIGKAARNWECFDQIANALVNLENDETLLIQSGKPVAIVPTHEDAPRVILSNSMLVPKWATWEVFHELDKKGLIMYGQMTAGSWIYIGTQGILQGTYETFAAAAKKHFDSDLRGKFVFSAGLGGMGGAQPLAVTMNEGVILCVDMQPQCIERRLKTKYLDVQAQNLDEALKLALDAVDNKKPLSIGLCANVVDVLEELLKRNVKIDLMTDQTSAHDELNGYFPQGLTLKEALELRKQNPKNYIERSLATMKKHVELMQEFQKRGTFVFDYGNNLRGQALRAGHPNPFTFDGFVPNYIRPLFCEGKGPFRWVALSGDPKDIEVTDEAISELFSNNKTLTRWLNLAQERVQFQGLPARICWLGYGEREKAGLLFNELVRSGKVKAPIVIGRDHLDCGSVASPYRETEKMKDGSDAIADWPVLNFGLAIASSASWVSLHHGGGVGMGYSIHSGVVVVADGTTYTDRKLKRVLNSDPAMGIIRHVDANYDEAKNAYFNAKKSNYLRFKIPSLEEKNHE